MNPILDRSTIALRVLQEQVAALEAENNALRERLHRRHASGVLPLSQEAQIVTTTATELHPVIRVMASNDYNGAHVILMADDVEGRVRRWHYMVDRARVYGMHQAIVTSYATRLLETAIFHLVHDIQKDAHAAAQ